MKDLFLSLRRFRRERDRQLAREWHERLSHELDPETARLLRNFLSRFAVSRREDRIAVGHHVLTDPRIPVGMTPAEILSQHWWTTGASGTGKSYAALLLFTQLFLSTRPATVVVDLKGEMSQLLAEIMPALFALVEGTEALPPIRIIRPFGSNYIPLLRLTEPEPGVSPEVQALNLATSLEEALSRDLGLRMERILLKTCSLAIELQEPLTVLLHWLENPAALAQAALRSNDPRLRAYVRHSFDRELASSREALLARLDTFFLLPETRLALSAPRCLSFPDCLESGITIINLGEPPAGAERVSRFWAGVLIGRLSRAILSRPIGPRTSSALVILEEFQEALSSSQIEQFKRLLALSRYRQVALWFVNQQVSQLAAVDPALPKILRTNTSIEMIFRCNAEDARLLAPVLVGDAPRRRDTRPDPIRELVSLPNRQFLFWSKPEAFGPQRLRSMDLNMGAFRQATQEVDPSVRRAMEQGSVALPRLELETVITETRPVSVSPVRTPAPAPPVAPANGPARFPTLG